MHLFIVSHRDLGPWIAQVIVRWNFLLPSVSHFPAKYVHKVWTEVAAFKATKHLIKCIVSPTTEAVPSSLDMCRMEKENCQSYQDS